MMNCPDSRSILISAYGSTSVVENTHSDDRLVESAYLSLRRTIKSHKPSQTVDNRG